jgi:DNA-binding IclR family transcriptional regulator
VPIHDAAGKVVGALEVIGEQTATRRDERLGVTAPPERALRS